MIDTLNNLPPETYTNPTFLIPAIIATIIWITFWVFLAL